jgi:3-deoxy-manno-octulosonate cytidylyltransferase (CMP-KDO synthetase)
MPGKPLVTILGKSMIRRVYEQTSQATLLDEVWVATDDERIVDAVADFGGKAVMTSVDCASGTDRLAEAARQVEGHIFVNVQGDQPFIDPLMIDESVTPLLDDESLPMATLLHPIHKEEDLQDPGVVKAVVDLAGNALYFSRSLIPASHNPIEHPVYEHVGLYVYRRNFLIRLAGLPQTILERVEGLEQLRVIEHGYRLRCVVTQCRDNELSGFSIDTPEDVRRGEAMLRERGLE